MAQKKEDFEFFLTFIAPKILLVTPGGTAVCLQIPHFQHSIIMLSFVIVSVSWSCFASFIWNRPIFFFFFWSLLVVIHLSECWFFDLEAIHPSGRASSLQVDLRVGIELKQCNAKYSSATFLTSATSQKSGSVRPWRHADSPRLDLMTSDISSSWLSVYEEANAAVAFFFLFLFFYPNVCVFIWNTLSLTVLFHS